MAKVPRSTPILSVTVAAELAGMHPQTVRQYDRLGLVVAKRTKGGGRRYSLNDVDRLGEIQRLSQDEGVSLNGIAKIFDLEAKLERAERAASRAESARMRAEEEVAELREAVAYLHDQLTRYDRRLSRVFAADMDGDVLMADRREHARETLRAHMPRSSRDVVIWRPRSLIPHSLFEE
ncbi:MerR family transcriptional regulator/heat shock protein HspR [Trueperella bonasi]|uniref:MerR family transcriptional regulator/heat shock protein HspR n=1 Tax=Trueperella bonasi TaxID=312286 RepID=A0ABT9NGK6_9ACTO|nr:MerR family transcriptional regulator [Trueperella bonasi]MDP9806537.1 MerR family transcriptional regulator/heat shock protein HspR [Trueperella bonasi]